ncbi:MAG: DUF4258 domain-containing protein [Dehalococcoidia bacterium]|nr:DUF4258 domain-containing protein [Dehalococcoidia bacterium]
MDLGSLRDAIHSGDFEWRKHALVRLAERNICQSDALRVITEGEVIEEYAGDKPFPSCLMFKVVAGCPLHVVVSFAASSQKAYIITVYEPCTDEFESDFRTRRE